VKTVYFDLKDADGVSHAYEVDLYSVAENAKLQLMCAGPLLQALGRLAAVVRPALQAVPKGTTMENLDMASALKILGNADLESLPESLMAFPEMIEARGGPDLVTRIFAGTRRCIPIPALQGLPTAAGDDAIPSDHKQALADPVQQDAAFGDGNMGEYWQAAAMVLIVNFTRFGRRGSQPLSGLIKKLTLGIVDLSPVNTETQKPSPDSMTVKGPPSG
jgi:hypothetical protein